MPRFLVQRPPRNFAPASCILCRLLPPPRFRAPCAPGFLPPATGLSCSLRSSFPAPWAPRHPRTASPLPSPLRVWSNLVPPLFRLFRAVGDFPSRVYPSHSFPSLSSSLHPGFPAQHPSFLLLFPVRCLSSPRTSPLLSLPPFPYSSILPCNEHSSLPTFYSPRPPDLGIPFLPPPLVLPVSICREMWYAMLESRVFS